MLARGGKARSTAQIDRWRQEHFKAATGMEADGEPSFAQVRRRFENFGALVNRLLEALRNPFDPGNAATIAAADKPLQPFLDGELEWGAAMMFLGEALAWGLRGADPAELDVLKAELEAQNQAAEQRAAAERAARPAEPILSDQEKTAFLEKMLMGAARCFSHCSRSERQQIASAFRRALLR